MNTTFEHYLLQMVSDARTPLSWLFPKIDYIGLNLPKLPTSTDFDLQLCIVDLILAGKLEVTNREGVSILYDRLADRNSLRADLIDNCAGLVLGLTKNGGEQWERYSLPNWDKMWEASNDEHTGSIVCMDINLLIALLFASSFSWGDQLMPDLDSVRLTKATDYPVTYWKKMNDVYIAEFLMKRRCVAPLLPKQVREVWLETLVWHHNPWAAKLQS